MSKEHYIGVWRSVNDVRVQLGDDLERLLEVISFTYSLNNALIAKSSLRDYEVQTLVKSLSEYFNNFHIETNKRLGTIYNIKEVAAWRKIVRHIPRFCYLKRVVDRFKSHV